MHEVKTSSFFKKNINEEDVQRTSTIYYIYIYDNDDDDDYDGDDDKK